MTACWKEDRNNLERANKWKQDVAKAIEETTAKIDEMNNLSVGLLHKALHFREYMQLLDRRRELKANAYMLEESFPPSENLVRCPNGMLFLKDGVIAVKRMSRGQEQYHWVGTFQFRDFLNAGVEEGAGKGQLGV